MTFLGGQDFCFHYIFKTISSGRNKVVHKKFGGQRSECPRGFGPVIMWKKSVNMAVCT